MFKDENIFGIVFVTGKMYAIYKIIKTGEHLEYKKLDYYDVELPNKHNKGGSSAARFGRVVQEHHHNYITKLSEKVINCFMENNNTECSINKLIIAGQDKKNDLANNELIKQYFNNKTILIEMNNVNDESIHTTIQDTKPLFDVEEDERAEEVLNEIRDLMNLGADNLVFGIDDVIEAVNNNELKKIVFDNTLANIFDEIELGKCELISISEYKMIAFGINIIGIKWY